MNSNLIKTSQHFKLANTVTIGRTAKNIHMYAYEQIIV